MKICGNRLYNFFASMLCLKMGPYFRDRVLIRTFLAFWVSIGSLFIFQCPYFHCYGLIRAKNVNSVCMYTKMSYLDLLANFDFYLCLPVKFHKSAFRVLILAAGGPKKMGPYWVPISKLGGPY